MSWKWRSFLAPQPRGSGGASPQASAARRLRANHAAAAATSLATTSGGGGGKLAAGGYARAGGSAAAAAGHERGGLAAPWLRHQGMQHRDGGPPPASAADDKATLVGLLRACASAGSVRRGQELHSQILARGLDRDLFIANTLVDMYAKLGRFDSACSVFQGMSNRDVATWRALIAGYAQHGRGREALRLYARMQQDGVSPDKVTLVSAVKACAVTGELHKGRHLHSHLISRGLEAEVSVGSSLVDMYAKCGSLQDARTLFDKLAGSSRNVVTWTAMIAAYTRHGRCQEAIDLFESMQRDGRTPPNAVTFTAALKACASLGAVDKGRDVHALVLERGLETDVRVGSTLVDMYAKCGRVEDARTVFDGLATRNVVTWSAMIAGYTQNGCAQEALVVYEAMRRQADGGGVSPDNVTYMWALKACASLGAVQKGRQIHLELVAKGLDTTTDECIGTALVDMYAKCGGLDAATAIFGAMATRNVVTWTAMIAGYAQHGRAVEALDLYDQMVVPQQQQDDGDGRLLLADDVTFVCILKACATAGSLQKGKQIHHEILRQGLESSLVVGNALVYMYAKCGSLGDAQTVFDRLVEKDLVTWNTIIEGHAKHDEPGSSETAYALFVKMQDSGMTPNNLTFVSVLRAIGNMGALRAGKELHATIRGGAPGGGLDESDVAIGTALVDMYAKCGDLESARHALDKLPSPTMAAWTALIAGYGQHHNSTRAVQCFHEMQAQGLEPDEATFTCLLSACSHMGLVDEGRRYFKMMVEEYAVAPNVQHYNCLVDLLGRAGHLGEAKQVLDTMPVPADSVGWTSLLNACKAHGDPDLGRLCFDRLVDLEPQHAASYALMASIYTDAGRWEGVAEIESLRDSVGAQKKPAQACIELNDRVHEFFVGDDRADTSRKLTSINQRMMKQGHQVEPHTDLFLLKEVSVKEKKQKEDALCGHAEKLALAFGLLNTPKGTPLLVTKNLRMCDDCHTGTGVLSRIEGRQIIVRDAHRVHHFCDGFCSCGNEP